ncbi:MAG TPA: tetratricopeptide repeat protein [Vicinamibacterales bacterium]|nr:tetratricopeptide repeat protein [Vicinamibacterales bacterium]
MFDIAARRPLLCLMWLAAFGVPAASAQVAAPGVIRGQVVGTAAKPLAGVAIVVERQDGAPLHRGLRTDASGTFDVGDLPPGRYGVTAETPDLLSQSFDVIVQAGQTADVSFQLVLDQEARARRRLAEVQQQEKLVGEGLELAAAGRYDESAARFRDAGRLTSECGACFHDLGRAEEKRQNYAAAEAAYQQAVAIDPEDIGAYAALAELYNRQRQFDLAAQAGARAAALGARTAPGTASAFRYNEGIYLWNAGRVADALQEFQAAVRIDPGNGDAQYRLALALINQGQLGPAAAALTRYLAMDPTGANAPRARTLLAGLRK